MRQLHPMMEGHFRCDSNSFAAIPFIYFNFASLSRSAILRVSLNIIGSKRARYHPPTDLLKPDPTADAAIIE
jgi:hypothetical protein